MTRPRGEVRQTLRQTLENIGSGGAAVTARQLAEATQVGYQAARRTLDNMTRSGEAQVVGHEKPAGSLRWQALYALSEEEDSPQEWGGIHALSEVMQTFSSTVD